MTLLRGNHSTNKFSMVLMGCVTIKEPAKWPNGPMYDPHDCYCFLMLLTFLILSPSAIIAFSQYVKSFKLDQIMIRSYEVMKDLVLSQ